jgi:hypothetical protein
LRHPREDAERFLEDVPFLPQLLVFTPQADDFVILGMA